MKTSLGGQGKGLLAGMADWPLPENYQCIAGPYQIRKLMPHGPARRRVHSIGRNLTGKMAVWHGLFRVPKGVVKDHFGILPGCEYAEILVQAAAIVGMAEYGWSQLRTIRATEQSFKLAEGLPRDFKGIKAGMIVDVVVDELWVDSRAVPGKKARAVSLKTSGRLLVGDVLIATVTAAGSAFVQTAAEWENPFLTK